MLVSLIKSQRTDFFEIPFGKDENKNEEQGEKMLKIFLLTLYYETKRKSQLFVEFILIRLV